MSTLHVLFKKLAKAVIKKWLFCDGKNKTTRAENQLDIEKLHKVRQ